MPRSRPPLALSALIVCSMVSVAGAGARAAPEAPAAADPADHQRLIEVERQLHELQQRLAAPAPAPALPPSTAPKAAPERPRPLDEVEPPFGEFDYSWLNGNNEQPPSLLTVGPLTWSIYIDAYYAFQLQQPIDHTIFPTTTAPRHNEISFNLGILGVELTGLDGPLGRIYVQYGSNTETDAAQDPTVTRGYFLTTAAFRYIEQAALGWHFHALHGINLELGIFPSYIGLESYLPQENWSYTHAFVSDATPYYFFGLRAQLYVTRRLKIELWLVNGWQTFGKWHETPGGGYFINWRPREWMSLVTSFYLGAEARGFAHSLRPYSDNNIQVRYYKGGGKGRIESAAFSLTADFGYQTSGGGAPAGAIGGAALANRFVWTNWLATTVRGDFFYDQSAAVIQSLPVGNPYSLPGKGPYLLGGISVTLDATPSPWVLFRLEYSHRESNQPYFSGAGGITGPNGIQAPAAVPGFVPDLLSRDDRVILNATLRL